MRFLDVVYVLILGIIEGITEWLPISSTGHLIVVQTILDHLVDESIFTAVFMEMFNVVIQLGAILAVVLIFFKRLWPFGYNQKPEPLETTRGSDFIEENPNLTNRDKWLLWAKVFLACLPLGVVGLFLDDIIDQVFYNPVTIAIALIIYGVFFILLERWNKKREFSITKVENIPWRYALWIGLAQVLAIIPGTSRSGVTILIAMLLLVNRSSAAEFSFFLSIPTMVGASLLKLVKFVTIADFSKEQGILLVLGMLVAFLVSLFIVKFLMRFIQKHDFTGFGIYRICLGVLILMLILCRVLPAF